MPLMKHTDACMLAHGQGCPHATGCAPAVEHHFRAAARAVRQLHGLQAHHLGAGPPMGSLMDGLGAELRASAVGKGVSYVAERPRMPSALGRELSSSPLRKVRRHHTPAPLTVRGGAVKLL